MKRWTMAFLLTPIISVAQLNMAPQEFSEGEQKILKPVLQLFEGMRKGDSAVVSSVFLSGAEMWTSYTDQDGKAQLQKGSVSNFLAAVGSAHDAVWDEPIWNVKVHQADNLATVWMDYAFYLGKSFLHCGVDVVNLQRTETGWKIFSLADTRKKVGCDVPEVLKQGREE